MKIKPMNWLVNLFTSKWVAAITLPPFGIYIRDAYKDDETILRHEQIHWEQYQRYGFWGFYWHYLSQAARKGYEQHPMEQEAYERSQNPKP